MEEFTGLMVFLGRNMDEKLHEPRLADIRENWSWVKAGLEEIIEEDPFLDVIPEDVFTACKTESAHLWITDDGFVVTTGLTDPYNGKRTLLIWFAWAKKKGMNIAAQCSDFFEQVAEEAGFSFIEVRTRYEELGRYIEDHLGWERETVVYRRDLRNG